MTTSPSRHSSMSSGMNLDKNSSNSSPLSHFQAGCKEKFAESKSKPSNKALDDSKKSGSNNNVKYISIPGHGYFPPPITCLKKLKSGRRCGYIACNKEDNNYLIEEVKIPCRNLLAANRQDGRLKLYIRDSEGEDEMNTEGNEENIDILNLKR